MIILVAEDEADQILLLKRQLKKNNFPAGVHFVRDGEQALAYLRAEGRYNNRDKYPLPGVILLDLHMPKKNGFEVLESLKTDRRLNKIPVVVLTVSQELRDVNKAYQLGAKTFIVKPLEIVELLNLCRSLCGNSGPP